MTSTGKLQGDLHGCIIFAANMSFTVLCIIEHLEKGVLYGFNLIGGWLPVSILNTTLIILVIPKSVSFSAKRSTFCFNKSSTIAL